MDRSAPSQDTPQIHAYCDGELDAVSATEFERRMAGDASLRDQYGRLISLRHLLRSLPQFDMPGDLGDRMQSKLNRPLQRRSPSLAPSLAPSPRNRGGLRLVSSS